MSRLRRRWLKIIIITLVLLVVALSGAVLYFKTRPRPLLPLTIRSSINYTLFEPTKLSNVVVDRNTVKQDKTVNLLSYVGSEKSSGAKLTFSQQSTPESFVDIPQVFDQFTNSLNPYTIFDSLQGKVYLTKPKELKGGQSAVMNAKGTLLFIKPDKNLTDDIWRQIFSNLEVIQ